MVTCEVEVLGPRQLGLGAGVVLQQVDVEAGGGADDQQQVGEVGGVLDPGRPGEVLLHSLPQYTIVTTLPLTVPTSFCCSSYRLGIHLTLWHVMNTE